MICELLKVLEECRTKYPDITFIGDQVSLSKKVAMILFVILTLECGQICGTELAIHRILVTWDHTGSILSKIQQIYFPTFNLGRQVG